MQWIALLVLDVLGQKTCCSSIRDKEKINCRNVQSALNVKRIVSQISNRGRLLLGPIFPVFQIEGQINKQTNHYTFTDSLSAANEEEG